jgi:anti-anti-sigma factor
MTVGELLSLAIEEGGAETTVRLTGELDLSSVPALRESLAFLAGDVVVDLVDVSFVDSQGIGLLIAEHQRRVNRGEHLVVRGASEMARRTFEITGADLVLDVEVSGSEEPAA